MPLVHLTEIDDSSCWALWRIEETLPELERNDLCLQEKDEFGQISNTRKKLEWLAARQALRHIVEHHRLDHKSVIKDDAGKPLLLNSAHHISIAHSFPFAAALFNKNKPAGIDLEKIRDKVIKIKDKFLNDAEKENANGEADKLTLYWCAKEAIYKYYGRRKLTFKENIIIEPFDLKETGALSGRVMLGNASRHIPLRYQLLENYYVCYSV